MDFFTETALARAGADGGVDARAEEIEREARMQLACSPGPIAIEDRLRMAYGSPVPKAMIDFFVHWNLPAARDPWGVQQRNAGREIACVCDLASKAAKNRIKESAEHLARLESRLAEIEARHSAVCVALNADPQALADPLDVGQQAAIKAGCERLMPVLRREIEAARPEPERAEREAANWGVLYNLGEVIAGFMRASDGFARDLGFKEAWQVCAPGTRQKREEERREESERRRPESERRRIENEKRDAEWEAARRAEQAAEAEIDQLDFEGLISFLFFERQKFTLAEIKERAAEWDHLQLGMLKEAVRLWPETPHPDFSMAVSREISGWLERRRIDPAFVPSLEEDLINRAVKRLARIVHPYGRVGALT